MLTGTIDLPVVARATDEVSLDELLEAAGRGDQHAFARLHDRLAPRVLGLVARILINRALAEETLQDVFLEVWRKASHFDRTRGPAHTWVLTIAHHRAVDRVRTEQTASVREFEAGVRGLEPVRDVVVDRIDEGDRARMVHAALGDLSAVQREALTLAYFGGHTQSEIAVLTDTPLGTVKTRMRDALLRLRAALPTSA